MLLTPGQIKPKSFEQRRNSVYPGWMRFMFTLRAWALGCFHSLISIRTFRGALTASVDSWAEIKSAPQVQWRKPNLAEFGGRCRKAMLGVWK